MDHDIFEWILLIVRWLHITVAVTWIGTSIFFMWLDRSFVKNPSSDKPGHMGDLWMLHGGGFYFVEKLKMGPTKVPDQLHWFKWESYWTWISGMILLILVYYTGDGTFLLDESVSSINYYQGVSLSLLSIFGTWFLYDLIWEQPSMKVHPKFGHMVTILLIVAVTYLLCHTLAGRAAYIHMGAILGTLMAANVFMRIIPRQIKMVAACKEGEDVNQDWAINAKNRSTHNTYFTLPVIFIMLSNHFPLTYGHDHNWIILLMIMVAGAAIREYFVKRLSDPKKAYKMAVLGLFIILLTIAFSKQSFDRNNTIDQISKDFESSDDLPKLKSDSESDLKTNLNSQERATYKGRVLYSGVLPKKKKLRLPGACKKMYSGTTYADDLIVNETGVKNVVVYFKNLKSTQMNKSKRSKVEIDQRGCIYRPRVTAIQVGTEVEFINSDPIVHNVKVRSKNNSGFNITMPTQNMRFSRTFTHPEFMILAKCSLHPWMSGYLGVFDHPYYAVTDEKGYFEIQNIPLGEHEVEIWHEVLGKKLSKVKITKNLKSTYLSFDK